MVQTSATTGLDEAAYKLIASNRILRHIPEQDLRALVRRSTLLNINSRDTLFSQGDTGRTVLVVLNGYIKLSSTTLSGREAILDIASPGSIFGELAVLNDWPRSASAMALTRCRLLSIDGPQLIQVLLRSTESLFAIIRLISDRLRIATEQMTDAVDLPAPTRVAKALIYLAAMNARPEGDTLHIEFQLSQRELGGLTGLTRESINKHLAAFRDAGTIRISGQDIAILNLPALRQELDGREL